MSNCTPCTPAIDELPIFCDPNPATTIAKRILVEDEAFCQKALTSPTSQSTLIWDDGIKWSQSFGQWQQITSAYQAKAGDKLAVNTSASAVIVNLPSTPNQFDEIVFADFGGNWGTNNLIIQRNGLLIENLAEDLICNTTWPVQFTLRFQGSTWRTYPII